MRSTSLYIAAGLCLAFCVRSSAENIDLSTVPKRDAVQLTIYNTEDITLVRETRVVSFKKGINPLQFSWANTLIDPSSVELHFLSSADKLDVADTTFPHDKPQMLYWNVQSEIEGEATIQITYFTSGITWSSDYVAIADKEEAKLDVDGFVRVTNNSGEEYENAEIRLVVGTINLVEKIAKLANVPMDQAKLMDGESHDRMRREVLSKSLGLASASGGQGAVAAPVPAEKSIIKEGLSEYFIYSVEGMETIPNGWSKRMRSFEGKRVPMKVAYRYRPKEYGDQLVRLYLTANNKESELGTTPLPDGVVRLFRSNGRGGLSYLTQQSIKYVPIGDKIELNLGVDPNVVFELKKVRMARDKLWMQLHGKNKFQEVGVDTVETEQNSTVVGWDDVSTYQQEIRNYSAKPIDVEIRRSFDGDIVFRSQLDPTAFDFQTARIVAQIPAGAKKELVYEVVQHQGHSAKQNHVSIEGADVKLSR